MARELSISYDQVAAAAAELKANGQKATVRAVRDATGGTGSMTTISRFLQQWNDAQPKQSAPAVEIPAPVLDGIRRAIGQAGDEAQAALRAELADTRQALADVTAESERTAEALSEAEDEMLMLEGLRADLTARLEEEKKSRAESEARHVADLAEIRDEIQRERQAAEAARTELAKAMLRLESMPRLEADLETARAEAKEARGEANAASRDLAGVRAELKALQTAFEALHADRDELKAAAKAERQRADAAERELGQARVQVQSQQVGLDASVQRIADLEARLKDAKGAGAGKGNEKPAAGRKTAAKGTQES